MLLSHSAEPHCKHSHFIPTQTMVSCWVWLHVHIENSILRCIFMVIYLLSQLGLIMKDLRLTFSNEKKEKC